jgi:myo-inositol-1(or 4)-monophosphatase
LNSKPDLQEIFVHDFITRLAHKAGSMLLNHYQEDPALLSQRATAKDAATQYDKVVDEMIIREIGKAYPSHSILTEESGFFEKDPEWLWIIDSLDGTGNFANQNPFFAVCIGVLHKGEPVAGAINAPALEGFYFGEKGRGAFLNNQKMTVSDIGTLQSSYIIYCEGGDKNRHRTGDLLQAVYPQVTDIRKLGSAGLEVAWVAAGRSEAYFTTRIEPWDVAAGVIILEEAGGRTTDFHGHPWKPEKSDLLFSNGLVHQELLGILNKGRQYGSSYQ